MGLFRRQDGLNDDINNPCTFSQRKVFKISNSETEQTSTKQNYSELVCEVQNVSTSLKASTNVPNKKDCTVPWYVL